MPVDSKIDDEERVRNKLFKTMGINHSNYIHDMEKGKLPQQEGLLTCMDTILNYPLHNYI